MIMIIIIMIIIIIIMIILSLLLKSQLAVSSWITSAIYIIHNNFKKIFYKNSKSYNNKL